MKNDFPFQAIEQHVLEDGSLTLEVVAGMGPGMLLSMPKPEAWACFRVLAEVDHECTPFGSVIISSGLMQPENAEAVSLHREAAEKIRTWVEEKRRLFFRALQTKWKKLPINEIIAKSSGTELVTGQIHTNIVLSKQSKLWKIFDLTEITLDGASPS